MQESWQQILVKHAMNTPHVDSALQAGMHAASPSMSGRVLYPYPMMWSDIGKTDGSTHGKRAGDSSVTMAHMAATPKQIRAEDHGSYRVPSGLVDATQGGLNYMVTSDLSGCAAELENGGQSTTRQNLSMMAVAMEGSANARGHNASAISTSDLSTITRSSHIDNPLHVLSTMAQISHMDQMNIKQGVNEKKRNIQSDSKNDVQINETHERGVSNSKCKQNVVHHRRHAMVHAVPCCQIDGCKQDLSKAKKEYHRRHKVCEMHSKASSVLKCGLYQRFCQQCSRFHVVGDFDDAKRSCRRRLEGHNRRRRKSIPQGYGNMIGLNQIQHQLMATAAMMRPLEKTFFENQEKRYYKIKNLQNKKIDRNLFVQKTTFPANLNDKLLALLTYTPKNALSSSSFSSSPSLVFNHGDNTCALSLLSCNTFLDPPLLQSIAESSLNPNISSNLDIPSPFMFPNESMVNLTTNVSTAIKYIEPSQSMNSTHAKIESSNTIESTKEISYNYPYTNFWKSLEFLQNLEPHHNANFRDELLKQQQAYSILNSHI